MQIDNGVNDMDEDVRPEYDGLGEFQTQTW